DPGPAEQVRPHSPDRIERIRCVYDSGDRARLAGVVDRLARSRASHGVILLTEVMIRELRAHVDWPTKATIRARALDVKAIRRAGAEITGGNAHPSACRPSDGGVSSCPLRANTRRADYQCESGESHVMPNHGSSSEEGIVALRRCAACG